MKERGSFFPAGAVSMPDSEIDPKRLLRALWGGKWILAAVFLAAYAWGTYKASLLIPTYRATAELALQDSRVQNRVVNFQTDGAALRTDRASINTELEVVRSRKLIEKLVVQLDLTEDWEFNWRLPQPQVRTIRYRLNELFRRPSVPYEITRGEAQDELNNAIDAVRGRISVASRPNTHIITITATTRSSAKSVRIVNALADLYIVNQLDVKFEATQKAQEWLAGRVADLKVELESSQKAVADFSASADILSEEALANLAAQQKVTRDRIAAAGELLTEAEARLAALKDIRATGTPEEIAALAGDRVLNRALDLVQNGTGSRSSFDARADQVVERLETERDRAAARSRWNATSKRWTRNSGRNRQIS